ncbi:uncharacterized protein LOC143296312 [Babylonia areolata]|uniref:uncharacterized protein LOC143296312 n=1 Tax=Babylonia areolata TaxID=304850 RepID=UPI003FD11C23
MEIMRAHVTCGRGTEPFVKAELLDKLRCDVSSVEDGKVFFTLGDVPDPEGDVDSGHMQMFTLKTVERIFATVTHFPTADIRNNGKVKFLQALKKRILNCTSIKEAVESAQKLRLEHKVYTDKSAQSCSYKCGESAPFNVLCKSPVVTEHEPGVDELCSTSRKELCSNHQCHTNNTQSQHPPHCSHQIVNTTTDSHFVELPCTLLSEKRFKSGHRVSLADSSTCSGSFENCDQHQTHTPASDILTKTQHYSADFVDVCKHHPLAELPAKVRRLDSVHTPACDGDRCEGRCREETPVAETAEQTSSVAQQTSPVAEAAWQTSPVAQQTSPVAQQTSPVSEAARQTSPVAQQTSPVAEAARQTSPVPDRQTNQPAVSFRFSVKCGGWCKKWLQPQRLAKELGIRLTILTGWAVDLQSPDVEICVHINDDFVTAGIPLTRQPLSKRDYIQDAGLRSTVSWIMAQQADIQPGHTVLDPMCGKATVLVEAARERPQVTRFLGCDTDPRQLQTADSNVKHSQLCQSVHLLQADALNLPLRSGSVDRIVCDAPFGNKFTVLAYTLPQFYQHLIQEMHRLLVPQGLAVVLTSQDLLPVVQQLCKPASSQDLAAAAEETSIPRKTTDGLHRLQEREQGKVASVTGVPLSQAAAPVHGLQRTEKLQITSHTQSCVQTAGEKSMTNTTKQLPATNCKLRTLDERSSQR